MIIRRLPRAFLFIAQQDHAALAAVLMDEWQLDGLREHPRRDAILLATREHDNGWLEEDAATHVDADGEPLDFISVPPPVKQRIWPRAAMRLADTAPYAGVLIAQHALALHGQQESEPVWRPFLARMERIKAELLTRCTPGSAATVLDDYRFLQAGDQLSLIFCNGWTSPFPRAGGRVALQGTTLVATPDAFGGRRIPLRVPARRLDLQTFPTNRALRQALDAADVEYLMGEAASTPGGP